MERQSGTPFEKFGLKEFYAIVPFKNNLYRLCGTPGNFRLENKAKDRSDVIYFNKKEDADRFIQDYHLSQEYQSEAFWSIDIN